MSVRIFVSISLLCGAFFSPFVSAQTVPDAPVIGVATPGDTQVVVAFTVPADGGSPITAYTATAAPADIAPFDCGLNVPCTVTGLSNETPYTFTVTASNAVGASPDSAASNAVTPYKSIEDILSASPPTLGAGMINCVRDQYPDTSLRPTAVTNLICPVSSSVNTFIGIEQFTELSELRVQGQALNSASSLASLSALSNLVILDLSGNLIDDISALAPLVGLTELRLSTNALTGDLSATLGAFVALEVLDLSANTISSIGGASSGVALLTSLRELIVSGNALTALPGLTGLDSLQTLEASSNQLTSIGIGSLGDLVDVGGTDVVLKNLGLADNQVTDLTPIADLVGLESLSLSDNNVTDLGDLAALDALEALNISNLDPALPNNVITSLDVLTNAGAGDPLEFIAASNVQLSDIQGLSNKTNLLVAFMEGNMLTDLGSLVDAPLLSLFAAGNQIRDVLAFTGETDAPSENLGLSDNNVQGFYFELASLPATLIIDLTQNPLICDDVTDYNGAGATLFTPVALIGDPLECSVDVDGDRFGAYDANVLGDFPANAFDQWPNDPDVAVDTDLDGAPDGFLAGKSSSAMQPALVMDAFPTDPAASIDTDGDGFPDDWNPGSSELESTTGLKRDAFINDAAAWEDTDNDGCPNALFGASTSNPPLVVDALPQRAPECIDADADGIGPDEEAANGTTDNNPDFDNDGLLDGEEVITYLTDPTDADTDGDDFSDGEEIDYGSDPLDANDSPIPSGLSIPLLYEALKQSGAVSP